MRIVTDSTSDLPAALRDERAITVVPLTVIFGPESFRDGVDLDSTAFYRRLRDFSGVVRTSQPSVDAFARAYESLPADCDIVSVHVASKLSGTLNSARSAADMLGLGDRIRFVDSQTGSIGLGALALEAGALAAEGLDADTIVAALERRVPHIHVYAAVDTLEYLRRGGRIGRASSLLGSLLAIKPVLRIREGEILPFDRVRTKAKAIDRLVEVAVGTPRISQVFVAGGDADLETGRLAERLRDALGSVRVIVSTIGPTVGVHAGPGVVGIAVVEDS
ncbi:MAG: DegV family protein [Dehalococcoidia bacterium]